MATTTDKLGLKKPAGTDPFLLTDFNSNTDLIDRAPGVYYCTSTTRPSWSSPQAGRMILETDTKKMFIWPGSGSFVEVVNSGAAVANSIANAAQSAASTAQSRADAAYALASSGTGGGAVDSTARASAAAASVAAGVVDTRVTSLRPLFYRTEAQISVAHPSSWTNLPDSPAQGISFTAPASGKITVVVGGQIQCTQGTTGLSYILRTGSGLGSGSVPTDVSGYTPFNPEGYAGLMINDGSNGVGIVSYLSGSGQVGYHSGLTPGSPYNVTFAHYNNNSVNANIQWRSMLITPLP
jgi:hypothetical protein